MPRIRPLFKCFGGKYYLAPKLLPTIEAAPSARYGEPYAGGLSVLLYRRPGTGREFANDANEKIIRCYQVLRDRPRDLIESLRSRVHGVPAFEEACAIVREGTAPELDLAAAYIVRGRMSRSGLGKHFSRSERTRGGRPEGENSWLTFLDLLPTIAARIADVEFSHGRALDMIQRLDGPDMTWYLDPPYLPEKRVSTDAYEFEMDRDAHETLLDFLPSVRGQVHLSGYDSGLYQHRLRPEDGWVRREFDMPNNSGQTKVKSRRLECLWSRPASATVQVSLTA